MQLLGCLSGRRLSNFCVFCQTRLLFFQPIRSFSILLLLLRRQEFESFFQCGLLLRSLLLCGGSLGKCSWRHALSSTFNANVPSRTGLPVAAVNCTLKKTLIPAAAF